ncbi:MAG: hypothetical protein Q7J78_05925, partial [Clostridiales bacterium]|nr:hypothetical protein [Clostridiales bacterium]
MKAKRILAILTIIILTFATQPWAAATASAAPLPDIVITGTNASSLILTEGSDFNLDITYKNISGDTLSGIMLDFSFADDIMVRSGGSTVPSPTGTLSSGDFTSISLSLRYTGTTGNDRIPIKFLYTGSGDL